MEKLKRRTNLGEKAITLIALAISRKCVRY